MSYNLELYKNLRESRKRERELLPKALWNTESVYVDRETGEIIVKRQLENGEYIKLKTTTKYETNEKYKTRKITNECEKSKQGRFWS
jgi:isocitrate/isopropylmalate dehydrogenase